MCLQKEKLQTVARQLDRTLKIGPTLQIYRRLAATYLEFISLPTPVDFRQVGRSPLHPALRTCAGLTDSAAATWFQLPGPSTSRFFFDILCCRRDPSA